MSNIASTGGTSSFGNWSIATNQILNETYTISTTKDKRDRIFSFVDDDRTIRMSHNNLHIQPVNNGFLLTIMTDESGVSVYTFPTFAAVIDFLGTLSIMDIDSEEIADNV
jgi:hypothetical protein